MILEETIETQVNRYCQEKGIVATRGKISGKHRQEISNLIHFIKERKRRETRNQEEAYKLTPKSILSKMFKVDLSESPIEEYLMIALQSSGLSEHVEQQYKIGTKRVDFAFPKARLIVEADGIEYHFLQKKQIEQDQKRDKYLARKGWRVLHIKGTEIRRDIGGCIKKIKNNLKPYIISLFIFLITTVCSADDFGEVTHIVTGNTVETFYFGTSKTADTFTLHDGNCIYTRVVLCDESGRPLGYLTWDSDELFFEGDINESARIFFEYLKPMVDEYISRMILKEREK